MGQIHSFTRKAVPIAEPIDFGEFTAPIDKDEISAFRTGWSRITAAT
ncbi:hypothetical protein [Sphingomonas sp.]